MALKKVCLVNLMILTNQLPPEGGGAKTELSLNVILY